MACCRSRWTRARYSSPLPTVAATASSSTTNATSATPGYRYRVTAMTCVTVLTLPQTLAGMTTSWSRSSAPRCQVTNTSRAMMTTTAHHGSSPSAARIASDPMISSLSASGSASCPQRVTPTSRRATQPSMESVSAAKTKMPNAHQRVAVPASPLLRASRTPMTGTSRTRRNVKAFARLRGEGSAVAAAAPPVGWSPWGWSVSATSLSATPAGRRGRRRRWRRW